MINSFNHPVTTLPSERYPHIGAYNPVQGLSIIKKIFVLSNGFKELLGSFLGFVGLYIGPQ